MPPSAACATIPNFCAAWRLSCTQVRMCLVTALFSSFVNDTPVVSCAANRVACTHRDFAWSLHRQAVCAERPSDTATPATHNRLTFDQAPAAPPPCAVLHHGEFLPWRLQQ